MLGQWHQRPPLGFRGRFVGYPVTTVFLSASTITVISTPSRVPVTAIRPSGSGFRNDPGLFATSLMASTTRSSDHPEGNSVLFRRLRPGPCPRPSHDHHCSGCACADHRKRQRHRDRGKDPGQDRPETLPAPALPCRFWVVAVGRSSARSELLSVGRDRSLTWSGSRRAKRPMQGRSQRASYEDRRQ